MQRKRTAKNVALWNIIPCILVLLISYDCFLRPNLLVKQADKQLRVPYNMSFTELEATLQQQGYVSYAVSFGLWARLLRYDRRVLPGVYRLKANMSNWQALQTLRTGTQQPVKIILHRAVNKAELAVMMTKNVGITAADFKRLLDNPTFVRRYGFDTENVLAMFIPNTYEVYWTVTPEGLFERMHKEYQRFWNVTRRIQAKSLQLSPIEITILASLVQAETNKMEEVPLIAGVYLNRMQKGMALQSCPSLLYALGDPTVRRVLHKYKDLDSPYNTYKHKGLPPGPINLPAVAVIDAVLNSTISDYLYFAAKEDFSGYHHFSRSLKEHLYHAKRYQKVLDKARIYR